MAFLDPQSIHNPSTGTSPPASWGDQLRDNDIYLHERGPYICTSATRPGSPFEGQVIYETDTDLYLGYSGAAWIQMLALGGWTSYTPVTTQSGTATTTVNYAKYQKIGRLVIGNFKVTVTASGGASGGVAVLVDCPTGITAAAASFPHAVGSAVLSDNSAGTPNFSGTLCLFDTTNFAIILDGSTSYAGASVFTAQLAANDYITGQFSYESTA